LIAETLIGGYPGPIAQVDQAGKAEAVNEKGRALAEAINGPLRAQMIPLLARAAESATAQTDFLRLGQDKTSVALDLTAIPIRLPLGEGVGYLVLGRDATLDRNLRDALVESRRRYKDLIECSSDFVWETDAEGHIAFVTARGALGFAPDQLVGRPARSLLDRRRPVPAPFPFEAREPTNEIELWLRGAQGQSACLIASSLPMMALDGRWLGARGVCRDVTESRRRDEALAVVRAREQLLAAMVKMIRDEVEPERLLRSAGQAVLGSLNATACWIYRMNEGEVIWRAGPYGEKMFDDARVDKAVVQAIAQDSDAEIDGTSVLAVPTRYRDHTNGALAVARLDRRRWTDDDRILLTGVADQLGIALEHMANQEKLLELARNDGLTGLLNRRAFVDEVRAHMDAEKDSRAGGALVYLDLDNFKPINDVLGHNRGDEALQRVARLIEKVVGEQGVIGRLGGDEFAVWLDGVDAEKTESCVRAMQDACKELASYSSRPDLPLTVSIGAAVIDRDQMPSLEDLFAQADGAMYAVKRRGKSNYELIVARKTQA
jgi:diguanylate cyclase (GGDEF)-like protein/PAS domain S-box-containing protein